jgi:hypothetical protein
VRFRVIRGPVTDSMTRLRSLNSDELCRVMVRRTRQPADPY